MDLMGSDAVQGEEALRKMWKDSMKDCNCSAARITYEDFVLIMKGQTRDFENEGQGVARSDSGQRLNGALLHAVNEVDEVEIGLTIGGDIVAPVVTTPQSLKAMNGFSPHLVPDVSDMEALDSPLSMDEDDVLPLVSKYQGMPDFSLPASPKRRIISESKEQNPIAETAKSTSSNPDAIDTYLTPNIPKPSVIHVRGKSRSFDEREMKNSFDIDSRRAVALPEHDPEIKKLFVADKQMSALQVNRQLYRSHRQMRLSVIDACKRFEEQQAKHARGVLLAEKNSANVGGFAGLVMRRVENKTVSSEEVKNLLEKNRKEQQDLMEKANKRSGGRRSRRKKTVSDLSTMMGSLVSEEMTRPTIPPVIETKPLELSDDDTNFRKATVPGEFRKVNDPFGSQGKYAAILSSS